jgi:hypothetical protein
LEALVGFLVAALSLTESPETKNLNLATFGAAPVISV